MSQIGDLRSALRENLKTIPGSQVSRYALFNPTPPGFHLWPSNVPDYHKTFGEPGVRLSEVEFTVQAFVAFSTDIGAQEIMDEYLEAAGPKSVVAAVESDKTLGGLADDIFTRLEQAYAAIVTADNRPLLTSDWLVTVIL